MDTRSRIVRSLIGIACLQTALGPQAVVLAQEAAPVVAPGPAVNGATMDASANGTPVLNISSPNSAGVSHNRFTSYDVDSRGLIINNSGANAISLLGGGTPGNANLANGSANLILNEVIAPNGGSRLGGYQEILGSSAELVIANPWGISCNGCGFINTPRVTLSTGTPVLSPNGGLQGFTINGGLLAITGSGLDASRQTALDLLARTVTVDGNVVVGGGTGVDGSLTIGDLGVFAGAGKFDYSTRGGSALPASVTGSAPAFAIDSSALGGMYADRIRLLVTEQGAGVRVAGSLAALADDLTLEANGRIELRGSASAVRDFTVRGADIDVSGGQLSAANVALSSTGALANTGAILGDTITASANSLSNSGTIWSYGDLSINTASLQQQRANAATSNPLIGAARDFRLDYRGDADLGTGDLQAGRDFSLTADSISDAGSTGSNSSIADVRYAGRNFAVTARSGGSIFIGGGAWSSLGDLRLSGENIYVGGWLDRQNQALVLGTDVSLVGGWGGTGTLGLTARSGATTFYGDASLYSGADLSLWQPATFALDQPTVLQSRGLLSIAAGGNITNYGTILGGTVELSSSNSAPLDFVNTGTGILAGDSAVRIGRPDKRAGTVTVLASAPGAQAGLYGGGLDIDAVTLWNYGLIQGVGPYSNIDVDSLFNEVSGRILGYTDVNGVGGLGIGAQFIGNRGLIYDSSVLRIYANTITNYETGGIAGPGLLQLYTLGASGPSGLFDNLGEVWGGFVDLTLYNGLMNGRDSGVAANRSIPGSLYALHQLTITGVGNATLTNYGRIESEGDIRFMNAGSGNAVLQNYMSRVDDSELRWLTGGSPYSESGHLDLLLQNPGSNGTNWTTMNSGHYRFTELHGGTYSYLDRRTTYYENQYLGVPVESLHQPSIRAGGNLSIDGFASVLNYSGSMGAVGDVSITSALPGSSVTNDSWQLGTRRRISETIETWRCYTFADDPVNCGIAHDHESLDSTQNSVRYEAGTLTSDGLPGLIYAGGTLGIHVTGTVTNAGSQGAFQKSPKNQPGQTNGVSVNGPGTVGGGRNGATELGLNGTTITLPSSANGRFVAGVLSGKGPLIETNSMFGLDSIHLGSAYLAKLLGLDPETQSRRLGDDNYEGYLIKEQVQAATGRGVLAAYWSSGDMVKALFDNAAAEAANLDLGYGKALTPEQIASLKSDIVWMVEQEVQGQKVLIPVVYLSDATRATVASGASMEGYNVDIQAGTLRNEGGNIAAANLLRAKTTGNIENISGRMAGWNVRLDAGGDIVNSTLVKRSGTAENGTDVAQRTAVIEAGNNAVLSAARDVNVTGAWVAAGKDAALIAGRNVNVESVALTANAGGEDGGDSWSRQTQTALGGGIVAGGNAILNAGQDANLKGADIAANGTTAIHATRDVNIGVLELTNKSTSTTTSTGRYDALDMNRDAGTIGLGLGIERKKVTETTTTTVGVGSSVAGGKGVQISTGTGDVNFTGSSVNAGADGIVIDSARNVNINAYNDKTESSTTTDSVRAGIAIDLSTDGVFAGTGQSGNKTTSTTTQTTARTSSLTSGGKVAIRAKGDLTNEGTQIDAAGDVLLAGENVVNKAARDTYTTSTTTEKWETKQQQGITTNGMGSSIANAAQGKSKQVTVANVESQVRLTGSGSKQTDTETSTQARTTGIKAGGNVVVVAKNTASDEGTQYQAGKDLIVSAESYENKAAADTSEVSSERTYGSGKLTMGVNTSVEVAMSASAEGGHEKSSDKVSVAKVGGMKAGGNVIIEARSGDVTLEGTQVDGGTGVGIRAAGDINLAQANNTTTRSSSSESGSGRVSGSVSLIGTGGSVGAGASTRLAESEEKTSTAVVGNIRSGGNVQLDAGRDLKSQGTGIAAAGNVALTAGRDIDLAAATDTVARTGKVDAGGADVNVGFGTGAAKGNGGASVTVDFERSRTDYKETTEKGSNITAGGAFAVNAGRDARLEGTQVDAQTANLKTGGNLLIESAQHTVKDDSYSVSGRVELSASKGGGVGGASTVGQGSSGTTGNKGGGNAGGGNAQVNVSRSYQDIEQNTNATINTRGGTTVEVGRDMTLAGANINAQGGVSGQVGGDLRIESRVDKEVVDQTDVKAYAGVGPVGGLGGANKVDRGQNAVQAGANNIGQTGVFADVNAKSKDNLTVGTASGISGGAGGIDVRVGGNTTLKGAANTGADFRTQGQTTIESVETRTKESSTDFRATGTVASAAGSDQGKGGDYGLNVAFPTSGKTAPKAGNRPNVPDAADAPRARPNTPSSDNEGTRPRSSTVPYANIPDDARPRANSDPGAGYANRPRTSAEPYANIPEGTRPRANTAPADGESARPRSSTVPYANAPEGVRPRANSAPPDNNGGRPRSSSEPYANVPENARPRANTGPVEVDANPPQNARPRPNVVDPDDNSPRPRANTPPASAPVAPPTRVALADSPRHPVSPTDYTNDLLNKLPSIQDGTRYSPDDITAAKRNLQEIEAYSRMKGGNEAGTALLERFDKSMQPPRVREDGLKEFALMPQYVGEDVAGFDHWKSRSGNAVPGRSYRDDAVRVIAPPVKYFTEQERQASRVYIASDGTLVDAAGKRLDSGSYIFVVDKQGRMMVMPWQPTDAGKVHHSSFTGGEPVLMAGEFKSAFGEIEAISNRSGHYRPDDESFQRFVKDLLTQGMRFPNGARTDTVAVTGLSGGGIDLRVTSSDRIQPRNPDSSDPRIGMLSDMKSAFPPPPSRVPGTDDDTHVPIPPVIQPGQKDLYNTDK